MERCWERRYPWPHSEEQSGWYHENCITRCREQFVECEKEQEQALREKEKKLNFSRMDRAIDWIRENKEVVTIGTVVIVGGVAFVLAISPPGWLVLIPLGVAAAN
jgi:aryl-alcohol dehydrogenase-like predicted oxidoreductase